MLCKSGERPPCMQKIFSSMMAAIGKQLKQSVNVFQSLMLYLRLPTEIELVQQPFNSSRPFLSHYAYIRRKSHIYGLY